MSTANGTASSPVALLTGGAGFVGVNLAKRLLDEGRRVCILDNLARAGVRNNLRFLQERYPARLDVLVADVRDDGAVTRAVERADEIYHLAAQVAVTTSLTAPVEDFDINARGTLNVLEAARRRKPAPLVIYTSTNKVYGNLADVALKKQSQRYVPVDKALREKGVDESRTLDFHSPYGCSKGSAEQYVLEYARSYGLPAVVFRMSCIYGPHQYGNEDQGWVAHFLIQARAGRPVSVYGDGFQVRDVLFVEDLVEAFCAARQRIDALRGCAFNIGGGPANTLSLLELLSLLNERQGHAVATQFVGWRTADQRYYVSNTSRFTAVTGWQARTPPREGIERLSQWLEAALPLSRGAPLPMAVSQ